MRLFHGPSRAIGIAIMASMLPFAAPSTPAADTAEVDIQKLRKAAAQRERRIIFDNDGNEVVYQMDEATPEALLQARMKGIVGTQVDTAVYCTWSSGFSYFTHNTKAGVPFVTTAEEAGKGPGSGFSRNKTQALFDQGLDPLTIVTEFCREQDLEVFWSMRMNDTHDGGGAWYSPLMFPPVKKEHPEYLIGTRDERPKNGAWSAVDYTRPEIRDMAFSFIEEVCKNYDVDGVVLDFFRHPVYFKRFAMEGSVGQAELDMMSDLLQRVRTMADAVGQERGKPILITVRVPDSVGYCRAMGLDIERWMKEDLIDIMAVSDYFRLNPWEVSVALGQRYGVPVYPCLSETRMRDPEAKKIRASLESYRARAMDVWAAGADGVYMFNFFASPHPLWSELGDPEKLARLDKVYTTGARGLGQMPHWNKEGEQYLNREHLSPERPRHLKPGAETSVELRLDTPESGATVKLNLRLNEGADPGALGASLNGEALAQTSTDGQWASFTVDRARVTTGMNTVTLSNGAGAESAVTVEDMNVRVSYPAR